MKEQFTQRLKKIEDVLTKKLPENFSSNWQWGIFNTSPNQEFSQNEIPFDRIEINVTYDDEDNRCFEFTAIGTGMDKIIEGLKN